MNKIWDKDSIMNLLATNNKAVERALIVLLNNQTEQEKNCQATFVHNNSGFNSTDAHIMTSMAEWVLSGKSLTPKQLAFLRKANKTGVMRIGKYHRQLLNAVAVKQAKINNNVQTSDPEDVALCNGEAQ